MSQSYKEHIKQLLSQPLRGADAHSTMMSYRRETPDMARQMNPPARQSAVMMLLFPKENQWHTVFMLRPSNQGVHSGQLSFPGGKLEEQDANLLDTAIRETFEEVGVQIAADHVVGRLSELYIPPSHFIVQPYVAVLEEEPEFIPQSDEVVQLITYPIELFLRENLVKSKDIFIPKYQTTINAPYFDIDGHVLWGATAMMVQEFRMMVGGVHS